MSGRKTESKEIDGVKVETTQLPLMKSLEMSARWMRAITPGLPVIAPFVLSAAGDKAKAKAAFEKVMGDPALLSQSLNALFANTSVTELRQLIVDTLAYTVVIHEGRRVELTGSAKLDEAIPTLKLCVAIVSFVLGVNYDNFFDGEPSTESA